MSKIDQQLAEDLKSLSDSLALWVRVRKVLDPITEALDALDIETRFQGYYLQISFTGDKHRLADVVRILRTNGLSTENAPPAPNSSSWNAWYYHEDREISAFVYFTSSVCRRVQVGTRTEEVPVYETRCGEVDA
jgi:hypothetical protein